MKTLIALALTALALSAQATEDSGKKAPTAQQLRMKQCNEQATGKRGDERKAFMKECLSKKA